MKQRDSVFKIYRKRIWRFKHKLLINIKILAKLSDTSLLSEMNRNRDALKPAMFHSPQESVVNYSY